MSPRAERRAFAAGQRRRDLGRTRRPPPIVFTEPRLRPLSARGCRLLAWTLTAILALVLAAAARATPEAVAALREADASIVRLQSELGAQSQDLEQARTDLAAREVELAAKQAREVALVGQVNELGSRVVEAEKSLRAAEGSLRWWRSLAGVVAALVLIYVVLRLRGIIPW